ncbi:long-chain-fatty-acid--CoA ligase [Candidatus Binatia bacterium]|nr:long-chain-fatty-acid--CoA ligase [Candidatus Binatia bacterium]
MLRLHDPFDFRVREMPDGEFAVFNGTRTTYGEAAIAVHRLANALLAAGLKRGDRFAYLSKNAPEYAFLFLAASKIGAVPVPLNYRLAPPEWQYIVDDAKARLLIARGEYVAAIEPVRAQLATVERCVALAAPDIPAGWQPYDDFVGGAPATAPDVHVTSDDDLYQMYTSGTTGRPKGAVLAQGAVMAQLAQASFALGSAPGERALIVAPMYHAAAAIMTCSTIWFGGSLYIQEDFHPVHAVEALSEERIGRALLVPAMIQACLVMVPDVAERKYDALRYIVYGASPISEATLARAIDVFGCDFVQGYGMTETTAAVTYLLPSDHHRALAGKPELLLSAGRAMVGTEVRVVDAQDRPLPPGEVGEIVARGPQMMRGYWNLPEASREALRGGWMHTGDAGRMDEEGYLYISDRVKDMIVSGGENVYPREVEEVLFQHPAIADVAVIGVPDEKWGETVKAIVVLREGASADAALILEHCQGKLAGYKRPRSVDFVDALPRNPSGKVLKRELREPYWAGHGRRVS